MKLPLPRKSAPLILFFIISIILEILLVAAFQALGLTDTSAWTTTLLIPGTNSPLAFSVIFHALPIAVVIVLLVSWAYLRKTSAFLHRETLRRPSQQPRRIQETGRLRSVKRTWRNLDRRLQRLGKSIRTGIGKVPGASAISNRISSAQATLKSALAILLIFGAIALTMFLVEYPNIIHDLTIDLYRGSPGLVDFVQGTGQWLRGIGTAVPPLGDFGAAINNALVAAAPGFRQSLEATGTTLTRPITQLDIIGKFALSQNLAAYAAAIIALMYGAYASTRRRRVRGR